MAEIDTFHQEQGREGEPRAAVRRIAVGNKVVCGPETVPGRGRLLRHGDRGNQSRRKPLFITSAGGGERGRAEQGRVVSTYRGNGRRQRGATHAAVSRSRCPPYRLLRSGNRRPRTRALRRLRQSPAGGDGARREFHLRYAS